MIDYIKLKELLNERLCSLDYYDLQTVDLSPNIEGNAFTFLFFKVAYLRIIYLKTKTNIEIKSEFIPLFSLPSEYEFKEKDELWDKVIFNGFGDGVDCIINSIIENAKNICEFAYLSQEVDSFGCCSRFTECSDNLKCIQPDILLAKGCYYKTNLENGRIFYGKNKNI